MAAPSILAWISAQKLLHSIPIGTRGKGMEILAPRSSRDGHCGTDRPSLSPAGDYRLEPNGCRQRNLAHGATSVPPAIT